MPLPDFLKRENRPKANEIEKEFFRKIKEYEEYFGEELGTEPSCFSLDEWIEIINTCIKEKKTYEELTGEVLEEEWL